MIVSSRGLFIFAFILQNTFFKCDNENIKIDIDHIKFEPECGKLPQKASSRISNAEDSDQLYPWVVEVSRSNDYMEIDANDCTGSIITKNSVVTAAHCICGLTTKKDLDAEQDIRDKIACKGGRGNIKDVNNLPNEVTSDNEIEIGAGSTNYRNLPFHFDILYAYVHDEYQDPVVTPTAGNPEIDVALLKTYEKESNGKNFYDSLLGDFKIGPICLAAINSDLSKDEFEVVGWGVRYGELKQEESSSLQPDPSNPPNVPDPLANKHSCTTNADGPINYALKHCDVEYLKSHKWDCDMNVKGGMNMMNFYFYLTRQLKLTEEATKIYTKETKNVDKKDVYYPPGYNAEECMKLWYKADMAMRRLSQYFALEDIWVNTKIIDIGDMKTCYKDELFETHGWCLTQGDILQKGWGFCDSSCKLMKYREDPQQLLENNLPDIYQKMKWQVDSTKSEDACIELDSAKAQWHLCIKSIKPTITISRFEMKSEEALEYVGNYQLEENDYAHHVEWGLQQTCLGDSGGGHWTFNTKEKRATLIAITTMSGLEDQWCSSPSVVTKLIYPSIQNWIKKHAKIK